MKLVEVMDRPVSQNPPDGDKYAGELRGMADRPFLSSRRYTGQQARADRSLADLDILDFESRLISRFKKLGVPLFAHAVQRSDADQDALFRGGLSKAKAGESPHNHGMAVDIVHSTKAWDLSRKQWSIVGHVGSEVAAALGIKLVWGGSWAFYDPAHWELRNWRERLTCAHEYVRNNREVDGTVNPVPTSACVHCGFRGVKA